MLNLSIITGFRFCVFSSDFGGLKRPSKVTWCYQNNLDHEHVLPNVFNQEFWLFIITFECLLPFVTM